MVDLRSRGDGNVADNDWNDKNNQTVYWWEKVVYEAVLDGDTAVLFVKGLNLRPHKRSDPTRFSCDFGFGNWGKDEEGFLLTTEAVTAAQEVVRCLLPRSIRNSPERAQGIRVSLSHVRNGKGC